jgi:DNA-binding transcriptional ArsR family regulator
MNNSTSILSRKGPICPSCGRTFEAGAAWTGSNYCKALLLLRFIEDHPGLSRWELCQASGVPYDAIPPALERLREHRVVTTESEQRESDGVRYRYYPADDPVARAHFVEFVRRMEALQ